MSSTWMALRYTDPLLPFALALVVLSLLLAWRRSQERPWMPAASVIMLLLISSTPLANLFARPLQARYEGRHFIDGGQPIVVLSGACEPSESPPHMVLAPDSYERSVSATSLYHSQAARFVLVTGFQCAAAMAQLLESQGIAPDLILQEGRARNTHENAAFSAAILRSKNISAVVLVTDEKSMLRAELCFRREGVDVVPYPAGLLTPRKFDFVEWIPTWQAIRENSDTLHEFLGLLWYRWRGWV